MATPPHILILAAGRSTRMRGADKLIELVDGLPLLARQVRRAIATGHQVTVTLPPDKPERSATLTGIFDVTCITLRNPDGGMAASLTAGLAAIPADAPVLLLLADLPEITTDDLRTMLQAAAETPELILRATDQTGAFGHPVVFPVWLRPEIAGLTGDTGPHAVLSRHGDQVRSIALPDAHATTDLDTPEDWEIWRAGR